MFSPLFTLSLLSLFTITPAVSSTDPLGESALRFIEKIKDSEGADTLLEGTAINPLSSLATRNLLLNKLQRFSRKIRSQDYQVTLLEVKKTPQLPGWGIAHLQIQAQPDPRDLESIFLGLCRESDGSWRPGPALNTLSHMPKGFDPRQRQEFNQIEKQAQRRKNDLQKQLTEEAHREFNQQLEKIVPRSSLKNISAEKLFRSFLRACREKDYPAAIAYLGEHEVISPQNHQDVLEAVKLGLRGKDHHQYWKQLTERRYAWVILNKASEMGDGTLIVKNFHPFPLPNLVAIPKRLQPLSDQSNTYQFDIFKERDYWRLFLPYRYLNSHQQRDFDFGVIFGDNHEDTENLEKLVGLKIQEQFPPRHFSNLEELTQQIKDCFKEQDYEHFLSLIDTSTFSDPEKLKDIYEHSKKIWADIADAEIKTSILKLEQIKDYAALFYLSSHSENLEHTDLHQLLLAKSPKGWAISYAINDAKFLNDSKKENNGEPRILEASIKEMRTQLLASGILLGGFHLEHWNPERELKNRPLDLKDLREAFQPFFDSLKDKNLSEASRYSLSLSPLNKNFRNIKKSPYYQSLLYLSSNLQKGSIQIKALRHYHQSPLHALSYHFQTAENSSHSYPLYLLQENHSGQLSLLPESEIQAELNRSAELKNHYTWNHLSKTLPPEILQLYRGIATQHHAEIKKLTDKKTQP